MLQLNFKKQAVTVILLLSLFKVFSQSNQIVAGDHLIYLKFSSYSVETDKLVQKEFIKRDGFKSIYTCIPAGIVVIESEKTVTVAEKEIVRSKIKSLNSSLNYEFLDGMLLADAEKNCAVKRNIEK
jgi:hypothetical protein